MGRAAIVVGGTTHPVDSAKEEWRATCRVCEWESFADDMTTAEALVTHLRDEHNLVPRNSGMRRSR